MSGRFAPITRVRMDRTANDEGGFGEAAGSSATIYGKVEVHDSQISAITRRETDVKIGDQLLIEDAQT